VVTLLAFATAAYAFSGEPVLSSSFPYKILTYSVTITIDQESHGRASGTATVDTTTVYRNQGGAGTGTLVIPEVFNGPAVPDLGMTVTWDKQPVTLQPMATKPYGQDQERDLNASVALRADGTHALRVHYTMSLQKAGYGANQFKLGYLMSDQAPIGLLTFAFKYTPASVFTLPNVMPDWHWQVGRSGASSRQVNFTPKKDFVTMQFYPNGFNQIGK
jgi:hypothetical protein